MAQTVNVFLGVDPPGHCLVGPYRPFGVVRLGPDIFPPQPTNGYLSNRPLLRFSHTHVAGTGGFGRYGNVGLLPFTGLVRQLPAAPFLNAPWPDQSSARPRDEIGDLGYYAVTIPAFGVRSELTCTEHVGVHRYRYPAGVPAGLLVDGAACILARAGYDGHMPEAEDWEAVPEHVTGFIEVTGPCELVGHSIFRGGWGHTAPYQVFFVVQLDRPFCRCRLASHGGEVPGGVMRCVVGRGARAILEFEAGIELNVRVGISFVSIAQARAHIDREVGNADFDAVRRATEEIWTKLLDRFRVEGGTAEQRRIFRSLIYRLYCMPTDLGVDLEDPYRRSGRRTFTDFYCLWDSVRNANSFFHLFDPGLSADMLNSLLDIGESAGWLPDAHIAGHHAFMQSGCSADILFAEAALKGVPGVDYAKALRLTSKNALQDPPDPMISGRWLGDYHRLGYVSTTVAKGCVSRHIEYTYYDDCIARLAAFLGEREHARRFREFAGRLWNLWRDDVRCFWPRRPDGSWVESALVNPDSEIPDGWNDPYTYEASLRAWSWNAFHDIPGLIRRLGGPESFVAALDEFFDRGLWRCKETLMHVPHLYSYAGRPDRAADRVRESLERCFRDDRKGLSDNEDMGCQSAYFLWNSIGLYPIMGQTHYMLVPPVFDRIEMDMGGWRPNGRLVITVDRSRGSMYVERVQLGRRALDRCWITHSELLADPQLHFVLKDQPGAWGRQHPPPSPSNDSIVV